MTEQVKVIRLWCCDDCGELHPRTTEFPFHEQPPLPNHHSVWVGYTATKDPDDDDE